LDSLVSASRTPISATPNPSRAPFSIGATAAGKYTFTSV
jgi:hypothetical protein